MPVEYVEGDILEAKTQVVVNTVNCEGFMGKGLALQFKKAYPEMFKEYKQKCVEGEIEIGKLHLYKNSFRYWILNFPTKDRWRQNSKLDYIQKGLEEFKNRYHEWGITSIAFPRLGCQQGGLDWKDVRPLMEKYLDNLPSVAVQIFSFKPSEKKPTKKRKPKKPTLKKLSQKQQTIADYSNKKT
ncbi:MAG: macro domain-containing protein [Candidatus Bathyarchaeia archaeon]|jgi:O-acetyl-ADP-ribose deacetylase (regulator of RNase III)